MYPASELHGIVGTDVRQPFDMRDVIARVVDGSRFREFKREYGTTMITVCDFTLCPHLIKRNGCRDSHMCTDTLLELSQIMGFFSPHLL